MNVVFVSNYYNHHQSEISQEFSQLTNDQFLFIETEAFPDYRKKLGYMISNYPSYVIRYDEYCKEKRKYKKIIEDADIVIYGSCPYKIVIKRIKRGKITFKYSERIYKRGKKKIEFPIRVLLNWYRGWSKRNHYLLCSSAFTYADYLYTYNFKNRAYKWGYFPAIKINEEIDPIIDSKKTNSIIWVGRFIKYKHPEMIIELAKKLRNDNIKFNIRMIGTGELEDEIREQIKSNKLESYVQLIGAVSCEKVYEYYNSSEIFLFTSNFEEGWGAVLNEAMAAGCSVVASHAIGSVPYLIEDNINGMVFKNEDGNDLYLKVKEIIGNDDKRKKMGKNAYLTIKEKWNAKEAAKRFVDLVDCLKKQNFSDVFFDGPCSKADIISNDWYLKDER